MPGYLRDAALTLQVDDQRGGENDQEARFARINRRLAGRGHNPIDRQAAQRVGPAQEEFDPAKKLRGDSGRRRRVRHRPDDQRRFSRPFRDLPGRPLPSPPPSPRGPPRGSHPGPPVRDDVKGTPRRSPYGVAPRPCRTGAPSPRPAPPRRNRGHPDRGETGRGTGAASSLPARAGRSIPCGSVSDPSPSGRRGRPREKIRTGRRRGDPGGRRTDPSGRGARRRYRKGGVRRSVPRKGKAGAPQNGRPSHVGEIGGGQHPEQEVPEGVPQRGSRPSRSPMPTTGIIPPRAA